MSTPTVFRDRKGTRDRTVEDLQSMRLGQVGHRAIALFAERARGLSHAERTELAWRVARETLDRAGKPPAGRRSVVMIAGSLGVYGQYALPPKPWQLLGSEVDLGEGGIVDLVWGRTDDAGVLWVFYDELKLTYGAIPAGEGSTQRQATRYAEAGERAYGSSFLGVRVVLLGAPRHSMLFRAGRMVSLVDSDLWFEDTDSWEWAS